MTWPDGFIWGTTSSVLDAAGAAPTSDWYRLEQAGTVPPSAGGNGFAERFADDFTTLAAAGFEHHRLGIDWARIEPRPGHRDSAAIEQVEFLLDAATRAGIEPWVTLFDTTLPGWFGDDEGGFRRDPNRARYLWSSHVDFVAETFGDHVAGWMPVDAPSRYVFDIGRAVWPPSAATPDKLATAIDTLNLCAADAARLLRGGRGPVAMVQHVRLPYRADEHPESAAAAQLADRLWWAIWNRRELLEPFDLLAVSHDHCVRVDSHGAHLPHPAGRRIGPTGFTPWPEGLAHVLRRVADEQDLPLLVTDCSIATDDEQWRSDHLSESIAVVAEAIGDGIDVRGCFFPGIEGHAPLTRGAAPVALFDRDREPRPALEIVQQAMRR